jgi:hypothetical protein
MRWEEAIMKAINELNEKNPEYSSAYLALLLRAGQLTTYTEKCDKCGSGG